MEEAPAQEAAGVAAEEAAGVAAAAAMVAVAAVAAVNDSWLERMTIRWN